jgi:hypothetical protein
MDLDWARISVTTVAGLAVLWATAQVVAMAGNHYVTDWAGHDMTIYLDATRRWLAGGDFYPVAQVASVYGIRQGDVLYPPAALVLFAPFAVLPWAWPFWYAIPSAITLAIVAWHRPAPWGWAAILVLVAFSPGSFLVYYAGTPTIWVVAALALATRWAWVGAFVLVKPTMLAAFALVGVRERKWWVTVAGLAMISLAMAPMTIAWVHVVLNARIDDGRATLLYGLDNLPVLLVPLVASLATTRRDGAWSIARLCRPHVTIADDPDRGGLTRR